MSSGGPGNPRRTPSWEKYDRLRDDHEEREMQRGVSNIGPSNAAADEDAVVINGDVFDIPPKNATLESLRKWRAATLALNAARRLKHKLVRSIANLHQNYPAADEDAVVKNGDAFVIPPKHAPPQSLRKWRKATLALNPSRRFRYTLDIKRKIWEMRWREIRTAILKYPCKNVLGNEAAQNFKVVTEIVPTLANLVKARDWDSLEQLGGVNHVANLLDTDLEEGIKEDPAEIQHRRNTYGVNTYPRKAAHNFLNFVWEACRDTALIILVICGALSLAMGIQNEGIKEGWFDGGSITLAVILVILVRAISDYREYLQFRKLNEENRNIQLQVIRGGRRSKVSIFDLVVGDVVPLNNGDQVPADGILIEGHSLSIDESSMTGESNLVYKDKKSPFLMSGCKVADGYGTMLVTAVGLNTEWGLVMATISEDNGEETPLQVRLNSGATFIGKIGLAVAVLVFVILMVRFFTGHTEDSNGKPMFRAGETKVVVAFNGIVKIFAIAVTIVVVAVPEGLPLAVTLTLAYSMGKMLADKALVRRLSSCETMGSATRICCDKTGILTLNQLTVAQACIAGKIREPPDSAESLPSVVQALLVEGISHNTTGSICKRKDGGEMEVTGSPTEKAILSWALKLGMNFDDERSKSSVLHFCTFNSENKCGGVALKRSDTEVYIHWKGSAEIILSLCKTWIDSSGSVQEMTPQEVDENNKIIEEMAAATLHCIAFAYTTYDLHSVPVDEKQRQSWEIPKNNLTLLAIVGIKDPIRPNVREAVNVCQMAGAKVCMVTGDNIYTAKAIALECGILQEGEPIQQHTIIEGTVFCSYTEEKRLEIVNEICVMVRSSPIDKLYLVQALKNIGHVVAVAGHETNDVTALHEADIGLSIGIKGSGVAKQSSDIIILDDNFASVVKVVRWGRSVYANIQKFIQFQLTINVAALAINFVASVSSANVPFSAVQLLWVNLIMDTLGALALATETPTDHLMIQPPVGRREPLTTNIMWRNIIVQAFYQVTVVLVLTFKGKDILNLTHDNAARANKVRNTVIFNAFVFCQIFNGFNSRKLDHINIFQGLRSNHLFVGIITFIIFLQVFIVEFAGKIASTTPLNWKKWIICIVVGLISLPLAAIVKLIPVSETPSLDCFSLAAKRVSNRTGKAPHKGYGFRRRVIAKFVRERDNNTLELNGGVNGVAKLLHTDIERGIKEDPEEFESRRKEYGQNTYPRKGARNFWAFAWLLCFDEKKLILTICAALSLALGIKTEGFKEGWFDGGSIFLAVILVILVTAISDYRQHLHFQNMNKEKEDIQIQVIRGGRRRTISIFNLLVGDVVPLDIGDQVPGDGILIVGHSLSIDESSITGESNYVYKNQKNPFMLSGSKVADGYGTMLVTGVGLDTEWGLLMAERSDDDAELTPLQVCLSGVVTFIGKIGFTMAVVVFAILLIRFFTGHTEDSNGKPMFEAGKTKVGDAINGVVKIFAIAVTIIVVALPKRLPLAVTLSFAYSMKKMMVDKALVRRLSACETMGHATTICSAKTGILTMNQMTVVKAYVAGKIREPPDSSESLPSVVQSLLIEGIAHNTTGSVFKPEGDEEIELTGSPTEKAIFTWALKLGMNFDHERSKSSILHVFTFNSEKKRGGVALKKSETEVHIHWKGAAEIILDHCNTWIDSTGFIQEMSPDKADEFRKNIEGMAAAALRCVAFAYRKYDLDSVPANEEQRQSWKIPEENLTLLAIVGMEDPCRPDVREAVEMCQNAGVKVFMVTGDNISTAKAVALECGILQAGQPIGEHTIIEGRVFRTYTEKERLNVVDEVCVMGGTSPTDKLCLVQALKKKGHVVAVTGDEMNDAPALKEADIGLSMGIQGTEVAKESSDIIILDDRFASVVKALWWGRSVYSNSQKLIQFQLTVNVAAVVINFVSSVSSGDSPLTAVQLLWVNLIMDTLGALALATEPPTDHLMHQPPVRRREPLITNIMWRNVMTQALYQVTVLLILTFKGSDILKLKHDNTGHSDTVRNTVIFNAFVFCQIFNEFNSRKPDEKNIFPGLFQNHLFIGIISITLVLQVLIVEFAGKIASTTPLDWKKWILCIVIGFISWPLAAIVKFIPVPEKHFFDYFRRTKSSSEHRSISRGSVELHRQQSRHVEIL